MGGWSVTSGAGVVDHWSTGLTPWLRVASCRTVVVTVSRPVGGILSTPEGVGWPSI